MTYNSHSCLNLFVSSVESKATPVMTFRCHAHRPKFPSLRGLFLHMIRPAACHTTSNSFGKCFDIYLLGMISMISMISMSRVICD